MIVGYRVGCSVIGVVLVVASATAAAAQQAPAPAAKPPAAPGNASAVAPDPAPIFVPADYVIGPDDILTVFFWREKDLSGDVTVRPDGRVSLPLLNDIDAAGLTPEQLRVRLTENATKFLTDPTVTVVVKQINSRKVFITGNISKPGPYPLGAPITVMQLIAMAGGVAEFANTENIQIIRNESGKQSTLRFNYKDMARGKNLQQNILLKPGDTIVVP